MTQTRRSRSAAPSQVHDAGWRVDGFEPFRRCDRCASIHPVDLLTALVEDAILHVEAVNTVIAKVYIRELGTAHFTFFAAEHSLEPWLDEAQRRELFRLLGFRYEWSEHVRRVRAHAWVEPDED